MTPRKVVAAYQEIGSDGRHYPVSVTDDGQHWLYDGSDRTWVRISLPLPPEALGEVAAFKVGDKVAVDGYEDVASVRQVMVDVEWPDCNGRGIFVPGQLTKVPR